MGNLFSSKPEPKPAPRPSYSLREELPARPSVSYRTSPTYYSTSGGFSHENYTIWNDLPRNFESLRIGNHGATTTSTTTYPRRESREVRPPEKVTRNFALFDIQRDPYFVANCAVRYIALSEYDSEYITIKNMITNKKRFKVDRIAKIENPYLKKAYELKKEQKEKTFDHVQERLFFHGTPLSNLDQICKFNFDWRLCKAHKFGKGVSFSPNANYASNYSDKTYDKVMIVAKVMIAKSCLGNKFMELPDRGCDTSQKGQDGIVIVKYEDNEFCPLYLINYHLNQNVQGHQSIRSRRGVAVNDFEDWFYDD